MHLAEGQAQPLALEAGSRSAPWLRGLAQTSPVRSLRHGYVLSMVILIIITLVSAWVTRAMFQAQAQAYDMAELAAHQSDAFAHLAQALQAPPQPGPRPSAALPGAPAATNTPLNAPSNAPLPLQARPIGQAELARLGESIFSRQQQLLALEASAGPRALLSGLPSPAPALAALAVATAELLQALQAGAAPGDDLTEAWHPAARQLAGGGALMRAIEGVIVGARERAQALSARVRQVHLALVALLLLTISAEALFIFRPLSRRLRSSLRALDDSHRQLIHHATHDPLTGVGNRVLLNAQVAAAAQAPAQAPAPAPSHAGQPAASAPAGATLDGGATLPNAPAAASHCVLALNLDSFRNVNELHGHDIGDAALKECATRIQATAPPGTDLYRVGGDEFVLVLPGPGDEASAMRLASELSVALSAPMNLPGRTVYCSTSMGIAAPPAGQALPLAEGLRRANFALRRAKRQQRGALCHYEGSSEQVLMARQALAGRLAEAIGKGQLLAHYQPVVDLATGRIVGVEALARWVTPQRVLQPSEFLPLAEEFNLLDALSAQMLRCVARDRAALQQAAQGKGAPLFISVNFPENLLAQPRMADRMAQAVGSAHLDWLHVEFAETMLQHRAARAILANLNELVGRDVHIALDDFGTGHAALSDLLLFPYHALKVDRSFVRALTHSNASRVILNGLMDIAVGLRRQVIVKGVETEQQRAFFMRWPGLLGQGLLFHRPQPLEHLLVALRAQGQPPAALA